MREKDWEEEEKQGKERLQVGPGGRVEEGCGRRAGPREALGLGRAAAALGSFPLRNFFKQKCKKRPRSLERN